MDAAKRRETGVANYAWQFRLAHNIGTESMTPKSPMFGSPTHGLPLPIQYLARARLFRDAMIGGAAYVNAEMNWPKYALLLQAIELALKAYCYQCIDDGQPHPKGLHNHDLNGW
jgi:hypothetical protein